MNNRTSQEEARSAKLSTNATSAHGSSDYDDNILSTQMCITVYSILIAMIFLVTITRSISFYSVCIKASRTLHDNMFNALLSTTMRFFNINPPGRIMNRFSRDLSAVDESLPKGNWLYFVLIPVVHFNYFRMLFFMSSAAG